ncbi:MAG TPA: ribulokinase, partial [Mycobacterium sp.]
MSGEKYTVGVDFGTLSGRAVVVRVSDGHELAGAEHAYEHGVITDALPGSVDRLPPQWALQVPGDYINVLRTAVPQAVTNAGIDPADVIGIGTDFTACTMLPVRRDGTPLCELDEFGDRPHAYVKLWRHHSPQPQADRINAVAAQRDEFWLPRYGGLISSEWEFAKALEILDEDPDLYEAMDQFVEAADWIIWQLSGTYVRNACSAGYKGIRQDDRYPSPEFLAEVRPGFADFVTEKLDQPIGRLGAAAGTLTAQAA